ncbi:hypothetical protein LZK77_16260 [Rhizobium leguminosarum]|nr:hypothetical protein LZK77_16260 [Rhizobium leguminosarum]
MELKTQFREFLQNIRPTLRQKEDWRAGSSTLRSRLAADEELGPQVVATFLQGSVRRATAVRPLGDKRPDVDVVVVTNIDHNTTSPIQAMDRFVPFLKKWYPGKWKTQGRSFGIEMSYVDIDLVITALPSDPSSRSLMEQLYRSQSINSLAPIDEEPDWRLNKQWTPPQQQSLHNLLSNLALDDAPASEWKPNPLFLPDRDVGTWGRTHPIAQIQWTAQKNRACNSQYVDIVRALKWWRQTNADSLPKYPKGYPLEHIIGYSLANGTQSIGAGIVEVLEAIKSNWAMNALLGNVPVLPDHGVPEHNVLKRLSSENFQKFYTAASNAASIARDALENQNAEESGRLWRRLFGERFPLPAPNGGDRVGGFSTPARPAEPTAERFA